MTSKVIRMRRIILLTMSRSLWLKIATKNSQCSRTELWSLSIKTKRERMIMRLKILCLRICITRRKLWKTTKKQGIRQRTSWANSKTRSLKTWVIRLTSLKLFKWSARLHRRPQTRLTITRTILLSLNFSRFWISWRKWKKRWMKRLKVSKRMLLQSW